jgi:hypothetical protein
MIGIGVGVKMAIGKLDQLLYPLIAVTGPGFMYSVGHNRRILS